MGPRGGTVYCIQGPSTSPVAAQRTAGLNDAKLHNIQIKVLKSATWTKASGYQAISSWLCLLTSRREQIDVVSGQNDKTAIGARNALQEQATRAERERWSKISFTGVDGLPKTGQAWVGSGLLNATIIVPLDTTPALEKLAQALRTGTLLRIGSPDLLPRHETADSGTLKRGGEQAASKLGKGMRRVTVGTRTGRSISPLGCQQRRHKILVGRLGKRQNVSACANRLTRPAKCESFFALPQEARGSFVAAPQSAALLRQRGASGV
jgi:hypothetical protein